MIDWISIILSYRNCERPFNGEIISTNADNQIIYRKKKRVCVSGKHGSCINISDLNDKLHIQGNFAKFLQGHNCFGSTDLDFLVQRTIDRLVELKILNPTENERAEWISGNYAIRRVDCNLNWEFPNHQMLLGWLRQLSINSKLYNTAPNIRNGTVYFGQQSRNWSFKFYSKFNQINESIYSLPKEILYKNELESWSRNILRGELVLRSRKLKSMNLDYGYKWDKDTSVSITYEHLSKINISSKSNIKKLELEGLSPRLWTAYILYSQGYDLRHYYAKSTYYRLRHELLQLGVDISAPFSGNESQEFELQEFLNYDAIAQIPEFAIGTYLWADDSDIF